MLKRSNFTEKRSSLSVFWPLLKPHTVKLIIAMFAIIISSLTVLAFGVGIRELVDTGFSSGNKRYLDYSLIAMLGVILVMAGSSYVRFYLMHSIVERVIAELRKQMYRHIVSLDRGYFEKNETGDLVSRLNADTTLLKTVLTNNIPTGIRHLLTIVGSIFMLTVVDPSLTWMVLVAIPFIVVAIVYLGRDVRTKSRYAQIRVGDLSAYSHETIQGLPTIQSFSNEEDARNGFAVLANHGYRASLKYVKTRALLTAFTIFVVFLAIGIVLWIGGHRVIEGQITAGDLSAFVFYSVATAGAVGALSEAMSAINQAVGAADRVTGLLSHVPHLKGIDSEEKFPVEDIEGRVTFENVSFTYPLRKDRATLDNVSFTIEPGETVAVVGPSGSGKSTVLQLLERFYDPQSGVVRIDGMDITEYHPRDIRQSLGVVLQDPVLFSTSIKQNIRMGKPNATDEEVVEAAKLAQAHDFIALLPDGYNTQVGERGGRLSGGQRQRIAIARVLLKNPKILLLDEATSALDIANEQAVMHGLQTLMEGRTAIVVTHRLSIVEDADKILVMNKGKLVAEGTHEDLHGEKDFWDPEALGGVFYPV